jgi:hypothetical protein
MKKLILFAIILLLVAPVSAQPPGGWAGNPSTHDGSGAGSFWLTSNTWNSLSPNFASSANRYRLSRLDTPQIISSDSAMYDSTGTTSLSITDLVVPQDAFILLYIYSAAEPTTVNWGAPTPQPFAYVHRDEMAGVAIYRLAYATAGTHDVAATWVAPQAGIEMVALVVLGVDPANPISSGLSTNTISMALSSNVTPAVDIAGGLSIDFLSLPEIGAAPDSPVQSALSPIAGIGSNQIHISSRTANWMSSIRSPATYGWSWLGWVFPSTSGFHIGLTLNPRLSAGSWTAWELGYGELSYPAIEALTATTWAADTPYSSGDRVVGTASMILRHFEATTAGTSGATEPTWNQTIGETTSDGTVTWTTRADSADLMIEAQMTDLLSRTETHQKVVAYAGGGEGTILLSVDFESGTKPTDWVNSSESGGINYAYTPALTGSYSLGFDSTAARSAASNTFTAQSSIYARFKFRINDSLAAGTNAIFNWVSTGGSSTASRLSSASAGRWSMVHGVITADSALSGSMGAGTTYYLWYEFVSASEAEATDGVSRLYVATSGTKPAEPHILITDGTGYFTIEKNRLTAPLKTVDQNYVFDDITVSTAPLGDF